MMTTVATAADGTVYEYDEETTAHPTHINESPVLTRVYTGPTPPKPEGAKPGESKAQQRDRLRAELAALEDDEA
jgi:hypothetical protein